MKTLRLIIMLVALSSATSALASAPRSIDALLKSIDEVPPDRASLDAAYPDAWTQLDHAARDATRDTWTRIRAASFLSFYPDAHTRATLEALAADRDKDVRAQAIYTLGRGLAVIADTSMVRFIEARAADADADVAEHAVRALRWINHPEAKAALDRIAARGPDRLRELARTTLAKRALRSR